MVYFDFVSKDPREENSGMYTVMSDEPGCKIQIINLDRFPEHSAEDDKSIIYNVQDGTGDRYYYKISLVDSIEPMTQEERIHIIELCWDWWLSQYLL